MANTYVAISTVTVGSGGASSIDFSSIPQTYTDLMIMFSGIDSGDNQSLIRFNNDTSSTYTSKQLFNGNGTAQSSSHTGTGSVVAYADGFTGYTANTFGNVSIYIPNYTSSSKYKSWSSDGVSENNGTSIGQKLFAGLYQSNSAISSIQMLASATFSQYSTATLYGIKNS